MKPWVASKAEWSEYDVGGDPVLLKVDTSEFDLVADLGSIVDKGAFISDDHLYWGSGDEPSEVASLLDENGAIEIEELIVPGPTADAFINLTGTAAILHDVPSDFLEVAKLREEKIGKAKGGAPTYFQMGSSLPDKFYNQTKSGKATRDSGIRDTDKTKKKKKKRQYTNENVGQDLQKLLDSEASYRILGSEGTWQAGGCGILSHALIKTLGLSKKHLMAVVDNQASDPNLIQHFVVKFNRGYLDADGLSSKESLLKKMKQVEFLKEPKIIPAQEGKQVGIPCPIDKINALVDFLSPLRKKVTEAFYHGTTARLEPGDEILPPSVTGKQSEKGRLKNLDKVFVTKDLGSAKIYAGRAKHSLGGKPAVYLVEPTGDLDIINRTPGTTVAATQSAKVIKKVL